MANNGKSPSPVRRQTLPPVGVSPGYYVKNAIKHGQDGRGTLRRPILPGLVRKKRPGIVVRRSGIVGHGPPHQEIFHLFFLPYFYQTYIFSIARTYRLSPFAN